MSQAQAQRFSISDALSAGWRAFTANIGPMALYAVVVVLVSIALNLLLPGPDTRPSVLTAVANLIVWLVDQLIAIGWLRIALDAIDGRPASGERVRAAFGVFASFVTAAVLCTIAVAFGLLLLVVPGVIAAIALGFYGWVLVDGQERDALGALRRSVEITRGERLHLFGFGVVLLLLNLLGLLVFIVGVIVTSAVSMLALAYVYRSLAGAGGTAAGPAQAREVA